MKGPKKESRASGLSLPGVDVEQLEKLLDFMAAHELEEFEYEHAGTHIRLKKVSAAAEPAARVNSSPKKAAPIRPGGTEEHVAEPARALGGASSTGEELHVIKSPIVGTFYSSPSPEAPPFVKVGDSVHTGQAVCIVEAMKLMNEIEADIAGQIVRMLVENGQPVEYGQPLFAIRPAKK